MDAKLTVSWLIIVCLSSLTKETNAQKNGFRGGSKSYEVHVEASQMGTNLHYELPESKVKAASSKDWLVDNDNAEMLAINSPVLATVKVKHPKFSMKGQWPGYKTSFKVPKDVTVASKRADFAKRKLLKHAEKWEKKDHQLDGDISGSARPLKRKAREDSETMGTGPLLSRIAGEVFKKKTTTKMTHPQDKREMLNITRLLLPIAGMKNIDFKNPHISNAMKGVVTNARKVVDEAKTVLNDAANFITGVRNLVKATKDEKNSNVKGAQADVVAKGTGEAKSTGFPKQKPSKQSGPSFQERAQPENESHLKMQSKLSDPNHGVRKTKLGNGEQGSRNGSPGNKDVSKRSNIDPLKNAKNHEQFQDSKTRAKRRELPDTLESILYTLNGLKSILKYH